MIVMKAMKLILPHLDIERQKLCRLVCKSWNKEICELFSLNCRVPILYSQDTGEFTKVLNARDGLDLPSPFHAFEFRLGRNEFSLGQELNARLSLPITRLELLGFSRNRLQIDSAMALILFSAPTVQHLATHQFWYGPMCPLDSLPASPIRFPQLKSLEILNDDDDLLIPQQSAGMENNNERIEIFYEAQGRYFRNLIGSAPRLTHLQVHSAPNHVGTCIVMLALADIKKIESLAVTVWNSDQCDELLSSFHNFEIDQLKKLSIGARGAQLNMRLFTNLLSSLSDSLEEFSTDMSCPFQFSFPPCPVLRRLSVENMSLDTLLLKKLSSLKDITIGNYMEAASGIGPCPSSYPHVEAVTYKTCMESPGDYRKQLGKVFQRFPCAKHWTLQSSFVRRFCQMFAGTPDVVEVTKLTIVFRDRELDRYRVRKDDSWAFSLLHRLPDLKELEIINEEVDNVQVDISKIGFEQLPNLETLSLVGITCLNLEPILAHLRNVKNIYVNAVRLGPYMEELFLKVPSALRYNKNNNI